MGSQRDPIAHLRHTHTHLIYRVMVVSSVSTVTQLHIHIFFSHLGYYKRLVSSPVLFRWQLVFIVVLVCLARLLTN